MPKTPPLILPTSLPNSWANQSKVTKKSKPPIFASQANHKQITFDDPENYQYIPSPHFNSDHNNEISSSILSMEESNFHSNVSFQASILQKGKKSLQQSNAPSIVQQQQQQQHQHQHQHHQQRQQQELEDITEEMPSKPMEQSKQDLSHQKELLQPSQEQLESIVTVSQDLAGEFQKFMEEHRLIKKSIEEKKKELVQYTEEQLNYVKKRQAYFQQQMQVLKDYL